PPPAPSRQVATQVAHWRVLLHGTHRRVPCGRARRRTLIAKQRMWAVAAKWMTRPTLLHPAPPRHTLASLAAVLALGSAAAVAGGHLAQLARAVAARARRLA
ncbi:MAG: hypothetical protein M9927_22585, partial [Anaerolineae bacterium]|nr:hypothetical protein [Anaerolineae bacterium]